jgi:triosephosphate isomerase
MGQNNKQDVIHRGSSMLVDQDQGMSNPLVSKRPKQVVANWKMNGSLAANEQLLSEMLPILPSSVELTICCAFPYLHQLQKLLVGTNVHLGAQDVSIHAGGAYTGEVSAAMLREFGVRKVLVGHTERRRYHGESNILIANKAFIAMEAGLMPIVCLGETLQERESGSLQDALAAQIDPVIKRCAPFVSVGVWPLMFAYEPIWAIGTGLTASPDQAQEVHELLRARLTHLLGADVANGTPIVYGGSVKAANSPTIFSKPDIDGGLVGAAALSAVEFSGIMSAAFNQTERVL